MSASHTVAAPPIITGMTGEIEVVGMPPSLDGGDFINQTDIRLMHEGPGIVMASMLAFQADGAYHNPALPIAPGDNTFWNAIVTSYSGFGLSAVGTDVTAFSYTLIRTFQIFLLILLKAQPSREPSLSIA